MSLRELLSQAVLAKSEGGLELAISATESFYFERLTFYRDSFEHPKQLTLIVTVAEMVDAICGMVSLVKRCIDLEPWLLYLTEYDIEFVSAIECEIRELARQDWALVELAGQDAK